MSDTFSTLRDRLQDYLRDRGIDPKRRFRCLNPTHFDRNPSMGYDARREKVHCFACGADYDIFDLLMIEYDLKNPSEALEKASELYGCGDAKRGSNTPNIPLKAAKPQDSPPTAEQIAYLEACFTDRGKTDYFLTRGLSETTIERFGLGYDEKADCVVLPCDGGRFVRRSIREKRYLNEKDQASPLFRSGLLTGEAGSSPVFLAEGTFDALSAEELGFPACALNGAGNAEKAAEKLRQVTRPCPIVVLPDNDSAGKAWADKLCAEFPWLYRSEGVPRGKDLNEMLTADRDACRSFLARCAEACLAALPPPYEKSNAAAQINAFADYIARQAQRPAISTGFMKLDDALDGGLYDGLYVLGAISSLGKTAFCMQIADQIAQKGTDVLIFSLEMQTFELMARSISRETFLSDTSPRKRMAKTMRGVLDGRRYGSYPSEDRAHLEQATECYVNYARHLWFREGNHETGLDFLRGEILRHIAETGRKPVVLIDYLQIIAPVDVHFTDKQNLDRIVCALKKLSRELELTILAISSFNRENYNAEASMSAFKESGGIDYSADVLIGLQARGAGKPGFNIDEEKRKDPRELELKILKNRSAAIPEPLELRYYPAFSCFEEL